MNTPSNTDENVVHKPFSYSKFFKGFILYFIVIMLFQMAFGPFTTWFEKTNTLVEKSLSESLNAPNSVRLPQEIQSIYCSDKSLLSKRTCEVRYTKPSKKNTINMFFTQNVEGATKFNDSFKIKHGSNYVGEIVVSTEFSGEALNSSEASKELQIILQTILQQAQNAQEQVILDKAQNLENLKTYK